MHPFLERDNNLLLLAGGVFALLFVAFFPSMFLSIDEQQYVSNALRLQSGEIKSGNPLAYCGGAFRGEDYLSNYLIGKSIPLIPFTWFPFPFIMLSGLLIHLLNTYIFARILRQRKIDVRWSMLFLFFPAFVWEARTLFSEAWALTFLLAGIYYYGKSHPRAMFFAGLLMGLAALTRMETVLITGSFALAAGWNHRHSWNKLNPAWMFIGGGAIAALVLLSWNAWYYGNPIATQFGSPTALFSQFPQPLFVWNLLAFGAALLIVYPLLLLSPLRTTHLRWEIILSGILTLALFAHTTNLSVYSFVSPLTVTARLRYLIPLAGLLLIAYAATLDKWLFKLSSLTQRRTLFFVALLIVGLTGTLALNMYHDTHVDKREVVRDTILDTIPRESLTIGSSDDCIYFSPLFSEGRTYVKISDPKMNVPSLIRESTFPVYVMDLSYSNVSDSDIRQNVIDAERKMLKDFVNENKPRLKELVHVESPHTLTIYEWIDA